MFIFISALLFLLYVLFEKNVDGTVNSYYCTALPIIRTVLKNQVCNIYKYWYLGTRNLRVSSYCHILLYINNQPISYRISKYIKKLDWKFHNATFSIDVNLTAMLQFIFPFYFDIKKYLNIYSRTNLLIQKTKNKANNE